MRIPSDLPPRRPRRTRPTGPANPHRRRILLIVVVAVIMALFLSARGIAGFYTDYLWFKSLGFSGVFTGVLGAKIALASIFTAVLFVLLWVNLRVADSMAPEFPAPGPEAEFLERYHQLVGARQGWVRLGVSVLFALIAGVGTSAQWRDWLLFTHRVDFGTKDPQFHLDVGFYVFQLPFISFLLGWLFAAFVIVLVVTAVAHYLNGGIRVQVASNRVTPSVKAHLSLLLAALALIRAVGYWFDRYQLDFSNRGAVTGATYTDVKAQLPAIMLLLGISLASCVLLIVNIRMKGWVLPVLAVGLWGVIAVAAGAIYPTVVQRFYVQPSENKRELPYIARNIDATRSALGLDKVVSQPFDLASSSTPADLTAAGPALSNARLIDPIITQPTFQQLQSLKGYYKFDSLDVDRYTLNGKPTQVVLGVRELSSNDAPQRSWVGQKLTYTHGSGVAVAPGSFATSDGRPDFFDPSTTGLALTEPSVYFGEAATTYAIVNTQSDEVSLTPKGAETKTRYKGTGGVRLGSTFRRLAFALRFQEPNFLLSGQVNSDSRVLFVRDIHARVAKLAPFIDFDSNAYPVITGGHISWVIDGYTTTNKYPYAQKADNSEVNPSSGLTNDFNYARNSVKAVVDAYNGDVTFYVIDNTDPLIRSYQKMFPELFTPANKIPADLAAHFRYPEDLFRVQTNMYSRYHVTSADTFYNQRDAWLPALDPDVSVGAAAAVSPSSSVSQLATQTRSGRVSPYLTLMQLPGKSDLSFVQLRTFVPISEKDSNQKLVSFLTGSGDPKDYGTLRLFSMPADRLPDGPSQVAASMRQDSRVSTLETQLGQQGSSVVYGDLTTLPIGKTLLYVRPFYVVARNQSVPELRYVILSYNNKIFVDKTLGDALKLAFGSAPDLGTPAGTTGATPTTTPSGSTGTTLPPTETVDQLLADASGLYAQAQSALTGPTPDLGKYQSLIDQAFAKVQAAATLGKPTTTTTTTTAPSATTTTIDPLTTPPVNA
jgi:uncharacterized membrane protein (UPF0182 family)